ncbi:MAG TPA: HAMP domain-containing sensor histidine kinase [Gammaproteobacteria bacterium]
MNSNISLKNRIVIAFTIQTLLIVALAFSTISMYVDYIEETVLYEHLSKYLDAYANEINNNNKPVVPADITIYNRNQPDVPDFARHLDVGGHEIILDSGMAYHVLSKPYNGRNLILIKDQTEFEKMEDSINALTIFILVLFSIASFVFSRSLADRIIQPVVELSRKVSKLNIDNFNAVKLDYPDDEIGSLVKVIYEQIYTLNHYLQREKWFTGDISHELRTPMMIISSSVDLLKQDATTPEQREQIFQRIDAAVKNVNEMINTFLLLARGRTEDQGEPVICNLADQAHEVIENLDSYVKGKNIRINVLAENPVMLPINSALFSIVLTNLVKNAIFNTDEGEIAVILENKGFQVKDTGKGLPELVKQFINGGEVIAGKRSNSHLGLGLSIVKRICEKEKWSIIAYDCDNGGAGFSINF